MAVTLLNSATVTETNENFDRVLKAVDGCAPACAETTAGDYQLTATVDENGDVTYSWTAVESGGGTLSDGDLTEQPL